MKRHLVTFEVIDMSRLHCEEKLILENISDMSLVSNRCCQCNKEISSELFWCEECHHLVMNPYYSNPEYSESYDPDSYSEDDSIKISIEKRWP